MSDQAAHDLYNSFIAQIAPDRLQKILARYELIKMIKDVPGDIVECGVFKGTGFYTLAKLAHIMMPHPERKFVGFDLFGKQGSKKIKSKQDLKVREWHEDKTVGVEEIKTNLLKAGIREENIELVAGDVASSTKEYAQKNLGFRIAFLYLDVDNYEGTMAILKNLFPLVTPGGIVVFDEYGQRGHGEADAVHEYFKGSRYTPRLVPLTATQSAYIIKEGFA